jgi:hypothetical protein
VVGTRRASWRIISSIEQKEESKGSDKHVGTIRDYRQKIETELEKVCQDVLDVLDQSLIPKAESGESKVFYHKMYVAFSSSPTRSFGSAGISLEMAANVYWVDRKGDYHRYLAEFASGEKRKVAATAAHEAYKVNYHCPHLLSVSSLPTTDHFFFSPLECHGRRADGAHADTPDSPRARAELLGLLLRNLELS